MCGALLRERERERERGGRLFMKRVKHKENEEEGECERLTGIDRSERDAG